MTEGTKTRRETAGSPAGTGYPEVAVFLSAWALVLLPVEEESSGEQRGRGGRGQGPRVSWVTLVTSRQALADLTPTLPKPVQLDGAGEYTTSDDLS